MSTSGKTVGALGGRTIRSTARKQRNSKVSTARGPRDRRLRLSAETAIQFFDIQDRLGYQRATEAIDWLIGKAKDSIDNLSSQHTDHIVQVGDLNDVQPGYLPENLTDDSINLSGYNFMESSALYHTLDMGNYMQNLSHKTENSALFAQEQSVGFDYELFSRSVYGNEDESMIDS